jgi:hypothetical protein
MRKIYIGIDPDLRLLNAAIVADDMKLLGVFVRRNKEGKDDVAVENSVKLSSELCRDVVKYLYEDGLVGNYYDTPLNGLEIILCIESQNMVHTQMNHRRGKKINYENIRRLAQVTGCLMGAFSNLVSVVHLLQPAVWKGQVPKGIHHGRIYKQLGIEYGLHGGTGNHYGVPTLLNGRDFRYTSAERVNPGDFRDISDSIGLAVYGAKNNL